MDGRTRSRLNCYNEGGNCNFGAGDKETMRKEGWLLGVLAVLSLLWLVLHAFDIL
jgi:hypothetical protein